jgi:hypothetical protein
MWSDEQLRIMIDARKDFNVEYHKLFEGKRSMWWQELAVKINLKFGTRYVGKQVSDKFQSIVEDVRVSKIFKYPYNTLLLSNRYELI